MMKLFPVIFSLFASAAFGNISLPSVIGNHMVIRQKSTAIFWGWGDPKEQIQIKPSWTTEVYSTTVANNAKWKISVKIPAAGGPYTIEFKGYNAIVVSDVMIGEVWLCGGQSNMEYSAEKGIKQAIEAAPSATNASIRFFYIEKATSDVLQENCIGVWKVCTPAEMKRFSAIGYFFGSKLQQELNIPVGLINANWGGTPAEVWTPASLVNDDSLLSLSKGKLWSSDEWWPVEPGVCYNAMINPITNFNLSGIVWYQGESNTSAAFTYARLFRTMINAWRQAWKSTVPFYYVQIAASTHYAGKFSGALLREAQAAALELPETGMVVISDLIDDIKEIHPQNKKDVGFRLAAYALGELYNKTASSYKSPFFERMEVKADKAIIYFRNAGNGLKSVKGPPGYFQIAGPDSVFVWANASIRNNSVVVSAKTVRHPVAVRFAFTNTDIPNLFSLEGLPVAAFRTDNWEIKE